MNLTPEQVKNLNILADFMDGLNDPKFTMSLLQHQCGTPACALGYAFSMREFGLQKFTNVVDGMTSEIHEAVGKVFGKVYDQIFSGYFVGKIKTPQQWAAHCRAFLKANGYTTTEGFKTFMDRVMVPVDTIETTTAR
jgi:hypothetical protein